jgi:hypothetical protein
MYFREPIALDRDPSSFRLRPREEEIVAQIAMICSLQFVAIRFWGIMAVAIASIVVGLTVPLTVS